MRSARRAGFVAFALWLAALACLCAFAPAAAQTLRVRSAANGADAYGTIVFRVKVPRATAPSSVPGMRRLRPQYVSPSTQSMALLMDGKSALVADVDPSTGSVVLSLTAPVGRHIFTVTAYDGRGGHGDVLSTGTTAPVAVWPNGRLSIRLTLDGVVASVSLTLAQTHATIGWSATIGLDVVARDADGNTILNGTTFTRPFTLTSSDPVNGKLSQTLVTSLPAYFPGLTMTYSGANVGKIVLSATGTGLKSVTPAVLLPLVKPRSAEQIIVTGAGFVAAFSPAPGHQLLATFGASNIAQASAVDTANQLFYTANFNGTTTCCIDIYQTYGAHALVDSFNPHFIPEAAAIDSAAKRLYLTDGNSTDISIFSTTRGHALLGKIHTGVAGDFTSLAVDPIGQRLYLVYDSWDFGGPGILSISTVPPYQTLGVPNNTSLNVAVAVAAGKLYVAEYGPETPLGYVDVYDTSSLKLTATIGPFFLPFLPIGIAVDAPAQRLYVSEQGETFDSVEIYRLDTGLSFLEAFTATQGANRIFIAPDGP